MAAKWGTETTIKFIDLYKKNVCLWNPDIPEYKSKPAREIAYDNLVRGMKLPGFTVQEVKNKIKNLRSTYCQEIKKIGESRRLGGPIYEPSLRWLKDIEPIFTYGGYRSRAVTVDTQRDQAGDSSKVELKSKKNTQKRYPTKPQTIPVPVPVAVQCKKRKIINEYDENRLGAFDAFGKSVGMQLKSLSVERALMAQSQIQTLQTEYGMADLKDKCANETDGSFTFVSSKEEPLSPRSNCSNAFAESNASDDNGNDDDSDSVISMPEAKYFDRYPEELMNGAEKN